MPKVPSGGGVSVKLVKQRTRRPTCAVGWGAGVADRTRPGEHTAERLLLVCAAVLPLVPALTPDADDVINSRMRRVHHAMRYVTKVTAS